MCVDGESVGLPPGPNRPPPASLAGGDAAAGDRRQGHIRPGRKWGVSTSAGGIAPALPWGAGQAVDPMSDSLWYASCNFANRGPIGTATLYRRN
jgi:hypothetical protein